MNKKKKKTDYIYVVHIFSLLLLRDLQRSKRLKLMTSTSKAVACAVTSISGQSHIPSNSTNYYLS